MTLKRLKPFFPYIIAALLALVFVRLAREVFENETYKLDLNINSWISTLRTPGRTEIMKIVSDIGRIGGVFIVGFISAYLFINKKIHVLIGLLISALTAGTFTTVLKLIIARDRPELANRLVAESGFSFPSGHATMAFVAFPILAIIINFNPKIPKLLKFIAIFGLTIFPFVVGFSRLYLGVHYFTDVVAGGIVGISAACVFYYLNTKYI